MNRPYISLLSRLAGLVLVSLLCVCCSERGLSRQDVSRRGSVSFSVLPPSAQTKGAVTAAGESAVTTLDLLAFRADDGALDCHIRAESSSVVQGTVTLGVALDWYIVANAPLSAGLAGLSTEAQFLSAQTLLSDTRAGSMVMSASGTSTFGSGVNEVNDVALDRYACKVSVGEIAVEWLDGFATPPTCTVDRIVLMNVRGGEPYSGVPSALAGDLWYNCSEDDDSLPSSVSGLLGWDGAVVVPDGSTAVPLGVSLYAMPNPCTVDGYAGSSPWVPRRSRIALQLTIGGVPQWYSVDLPAMVRNTHYFVNRLVVLGPGMPAPDMELSRTGVSFSVVVTPWDSNDVSIGVFPVE